MELTKIHQQNLQTAKDFMATLAEGEMDKLVNYPTLISPKYSMGLKTQVSTKSERKC